MHHVIPSDVFTLTGLPVQRVAMIKGAVVVQNRGSMAHLQIFPYGKP